MFNSVIHKYDSWIIDALILFYTAVDAKNSGCANGASAIFDSLIKRTLPFLSASVPEKKFRPFQNIHAGSGKNYQFS